MRTESLKEHIIKRNWKLSDRETKEIIFVNMDFERKKFTLWLDIKNKTIENLKQEIKKLFLEQYIILTEENKKEKQDFENKIARLNNETK